MERHYKISFCTTCKGRLEHLKQTLPQNLKDNADYPNAEFIILDYDSGDGLKEWITKNFQAEINSGKIRYAKYTPAPFFKHSHAKNIAHRLATGDILCNLDADNFTGKGYASWLNEVLSCNPCSFVRPHGNSIQRKIIGMPKSPRGSWGRIALMREDFYALHGYDERYEGHNIEDSNLSNRCKLQGLKRLDVPQEMMAGSVIQHSDEDRVANLAPQYQDKFKICAKRTQLGALLTRTVKLGTQIQQRYFAPIANPDNQWGCIESGATLSDIQGNKIALQPLSSPIDFVRGRFTLTISDLASPVKSR